MSQDFISLKKAAQIFGCSASKVEFEDAQAKGLIPKLKKYRSGAINKTGLQIADLPQIGEHFGFLTKNKSPIVMAVFTTKGGVLKTTLTLNIARTAALHNLKTCVIGLDMQGDVTTAMGHNVELEYCEDITELIERLNSTKGLSDVFSGTARLKDVILPTELPNLFYIPETPELVALNESISTINRREYWLKEKIIEKLKDDFDIIIMDCSPNWNRLITNALVACDVLISPLECKINNFRNFRVFRHFLQEFKEDMHLNFESIFVPTRYGSSRKLSIDIKQWYLDNVNGCTKNGLRESVVSEEATALRVSIPEHSPVKKISRELRDLITEIHERSVDAVKDHEEVMDSLVHMTKKKNRLKSSQQVVH